MFKKMTKKKFEEEFKGKMFTLVFGDYTKDGIPYHIKQCILRDYD